MSKTIVFPRNFNMNYFYNDLLKILDLSHLREDVIFDFSNIEYIESSITPNLIMIGNIIFRKTGIKTKCTFSNNDENGRVKQYLNSMSFFELTDSKTKGFKCFEFDTFSKTGLVGQSKSNYTISKTYMIDGKQYTNNFNYDYFTKIFPEFNVKTRKPFEPPITINLLDEIVRGFADNIQEHSNSSGVISIHRNHHNRICYISICDDGIGFLHSMIEKNGVDKKTGTHIPLNFLNDELEAIVEAIFYRKEEKYYGISFLIQRIFDFHFQRILNSNDEENRLNLIKFSPKISIHSNNTAVVIDYSLSKYFNCYQIEENHSFKRSSKVDIDNEDNSKLNKELLLIELKNLRDKNYFITPCYNGVHLEININF